MQDISGLPALFGVVLGGLAAQNATPASQARKGVTFDEFVDSAIRQEARLTKLMRNFKPVVETYVQEEKHDSDGQISPKDDHYFLSRLDLTGNAPASRGFETREHSKHKWSEENKKSPKSAAAFAAGGFAQSVFPDLDHFDRQNYTFEFVRWETLGDVRCVVIDVSPRENAANRGFVGRIWVEDQDFNIVRFTGTYTSKAFSKRSFHFDSWRLNTLGIMWMPAYVYTQESDPHDPSSHGLWFKAQTRVWGYDLEHAGDHREYAKPLTDNPAGVDPNRREASQNVSPQFNSGRNHLYPGRRCRGAVAGRRTHGARRRSRPHPGDSGQQPVDREQS